MQPDACCSGAWRGAAAGAVGGIVGSSAMILANHLIARTGLGAHDHGRHHAERRLDAKPNDSDGTIADEPASRKAASRVAVALLGRELTEREKHPAGLLAHHLFGAVAGAAYGALASRRPSLATGAGLPYGAFVWLAAAEAGLPAAGLARQPADYPAARHVASLATHLVFGATVEATRRALMHR